MWGEVRDHTRTSRGEQKMAEVIHSFVCNRLGATTGGLNTTNFTVLNL